MWSFRAIVPRINARSVMDDIREFFGRTTQRTAKKIPEIISRRIRGDRGPDGGPQPYRNSPGWTKRKGDKPPLYWTGRLSTPSLWRIWKVKRGWMIAPPEDRVQHLRDLIDKGARIFDERDAAYSEEALRQLKEEARSLNLSKHVRGVKI